MRSFLLAFILFLGMLPSCKKNNSPVQIPAGNYAGTFQRQNAQGGQIANVSISFSANTWTGQSQFTKYPALCQGSYSLAGTDIIFENNCAWTAEFDWTLILSGSYKVTMLGNSMEFTKEYNSGVKDVYRLTKQ